MQVIYLTIFQNPKILTIFPLLQHLDHSVQIQNSYSFCISAACYNLRLSVRFILDRMLMIDRYVRPYTLKPSSTTQ
jgi:hypothetical protein